MKEFKPKKTGLIFGILLLPLWLTFLLGPGGFIIGAVFSAIFYYVQSGHKNVLVINSGSFELKKSPIISKRIVEFRDIENIEFKKRDKVIFITLENDKDLSLKRYFFKKKDWEEVKNCFTDISRNI